MDSYLKDCTQDQIDALDSKGFAALHYAVKYDRVAIVKSLLQCDVKCGKFGCAISSSTLCKLHTVFQLYLCFGFLFYLLMPTLLPSFRFPSLPPSFLFSSLPPSSLPPSFLSFPSSSLPLFPFLPPSSISLPPSFLFLYPPLGLGCIVLSFRLLYGFMLMLQKTIVM